jgi:hypothetical protein
MGSRPDQLGPMLKGTSGRVPFTKNSARSKRQFEYNCIHAGEHNHSRDASGLVNVMF